MTKIENKTRAAIAEFLPGAIAAALQSYSRFLDDAAKASEDQDSKDFKAHHDACKMAIAHIELLIKLAQWADLSHCPPESDEMVSLLAKAMESAQSEVKNFNNRKQDGKGKNEREF